MAGAAAAVGLSSSRGKSEGHSGSGYPEGTSRAPVAGYSDGTSASGHSPDFKSGKPAQLGAMAGTTGHSTTGNPNSSAIGSSGAEGSGSYGHDDVVRSAYTQGENQGLTDKHKSHHNKSAIGAAAATAAGAVGLGSAASHSGKSSSSPSQLGVVDSAYAAGVKEGARDSSNRSASGTAASTSGHGTHGVPRPIVEVIGIADRAKAEKLAHKTTSELSSKGVDLTRGKIVINAKTNEVYRVADDQSTSSQGSSEPLGTISDSSHSGTGSSSHGGSDHSNAKSAAAGLAAGGLGGAAVGSGLSHHSKHADHSGQPQHVDAAFNEPAKEVDPRQFHQQHEHVKEELEAAAEEGELANIGHPQGIQQGQTSGTQSSGYTNQAPGYASQSQHGTGKSSNKAAYGAAGASAGILGGAAAALGLSLHKNSGKPEHVDAAFNEPAKDVDPTKYHKQHEIAKDELEKAAQEGKLANVPGETTGHSSSTGTGASHTGKNAAAAGLAGAGLAGAGIAGASGAKSSHSQTGKSAQPVLGVTDTAEARELANAAVQQLQGQSDVLHSAQELRVDANSGAVTDEKGQFLTQLGGFDQAHLSPQPNTAGGIVQHDSHVSGSGNKSAFGSTSGAVTGTSAPSQLDPTVGTSGRGGAVAGTSGSTGTSATTTTSPGKSAPTSGGNVFEAIAGASGGAAAALGLSSAANSTQTHSSGARDVTGSGPGNLGLKTNSASGHYDTTSHGISDDSGYADPTRSTGFAETSTKMPGSFF